LTDFSPVEIARQWAMIMTEEDAEIAVTTLPGLIELATDIIGPTTRIVHYQDVLLLVYPGMATHSEFWDQVYLRVAQADSLPEKEAQIVRLRVANVVRRWINMWPVDCVSQVHEQLLSVVETFTRINPKFPDYYKTNIEKILNRKATKKLFVGDIPTPILPLVGSCLTDFSPVEIARQWAMIEYKLLSQINFSELNIIWTKHDPITRTPNLTAFLKFSSSIRSWITELIFKNPNFKEQLHVISTLLVIAEESLAINNFNAVWEIVLVLGQEYFVEHIAKLDRGSARIYAKIRALCARDETNFRKLRTRIRSSEPPIVPLVYIWQFDLEMLDRAHPDKIGESWNWKKFSLVAEIIREVITYQQAPYIFTEVPEIQQILLPVCRPATKNANNLILTIPHF